ncbi:MAG TPA: PAS domain-containing protein [Gemmatimonadaceae bacterium]|nr:PAS domain-containing protein [Gemmatimonadaceae bacterium]
MSEAELDDRRDREGESRGVTAHSRFVRPPIRRADSPIVSLRLSSFDAGPVSQLIVDDLGRLFLANARARAAFGLGEKDVGSDLRDLQLVDRSLDLGTVVDGVYDEREPIACESVSSRSPNGEPRWFDVVVTPLFDPAGDAAGASISFLDVTHSHRLEEQLAHSRVELESANQQLQSKNEALETTSSHLSSTVEQLESVNEELQSSNEALASMNVELVSANEELQQVSTALHQRSASLTEVSTFLESMFTSLRSGIAVLDRDLRVLVWNRQAEDLWEVSGSEAEHKPFFDIDVAVPLAALAPHALACLAGTLDTFATVLPARTRHGRSIMCRATILPLIARNHGRPHGVIVLMDELPTVQPIDRIGAARNANEATSKE